MTVGFGGFTREGIFVSLQLKRNLVQRLLQLQIPAMVRRVITPYPDGPDISSFEPEDGENFVFLKEEMNTEQNSQ